TPGTVVEDALLPDKAQNLLAALVAAGERYGLALVDLSTGEFAATEAGGWAALCEELQRLQPSEIVLPDTLAGDGTWTGRLQQEVGGRHAVGLSPVPAAQEPPDAACARLLAHFRVGSLAECAAEGHPL